MIDFPSTLDQIILTLSGGGYEAFYVGGCVRDALLGRETFDIDIATNATMDVLVECFKSYRLVINEALGALSFHIDKYNIEITRFRKEADYKDHRRPHFLEFDCSAQEDVMRRDFTINGLLYHPQLGIIDHVGGLSDIKSSVLRCIGDADCKFNEDYLRMLRLMRFKAQLGFFIEDHTLQACTKNYHKLSSYSGRIWRDEFFKLVMAKHFGDLVLKDPWIIGTLIPDLSKAADFDQRNPYHKFNLFEHTLHMVMALSTLDLRLVAVFHDLGKLYTQVVNEGRGRYPGHAYEGMQLARVYFKVWEIPKVRSHRMLKLIEHHDMSLSTDYTEFKKMVSVYGLDFMKDIIKIKRADNLAKSALAQYQVDKCHVFDGFIARIEIEQPALFVSDLKIKGSDLLVPLDKRKDVLQVLLDRVIEGRVENTFYDLLQEAKEIAHEFY